MTAFGYMAELARGGAAWLSPRLMGVPPDVDALLPYWLGAWALQLAPAWIAPDFAARIPFIGLLALTLVATWNGIYYLARSPRAQPVAFAFGGEALPPDYARAMADGGLLAFMACLGLAQLSHETTPALAQLCFTALSFFAVAAMPYHTVAPALGGSIGLLGLTLSGAPAMAVLFGAGSALIHRLDRSKFPAEASRKDHWTWGMVLLTLLMALLATRLDLWRWRIQLPEATWHEWRGLGSLLLWFTWPAWPLALWTLWRWRRQLGSAHLSRHLTLPLWFVVLTVGATLTTAAGDRALLLALPALATLAAFALPTLGRSVAALIDWFTLLFFTGCAFIIWVVWIAMQTGFPPQPAANVARLAPGFEAGFSLLPFLFAIGATLAWAWLVKWRVGRHRAAIWKSLVLPAGGAALSWLLLTTLWMPLLDFARSYAPLVRQVAAVLQQPVCVETSGLSRGQTAAFRFHANLLLKPLSTSASCPWLIVDREVADRPSTTINPAQWTLYNTVGHPADRNEDIVIYQRVGQPGP